MELIVLFATSATILVFFLLKRCMYLHSLIINSLRENDTLTLNLSSDFLPVQKQEISEALFCLQLTVNDLFINRPFGVVSAEKILRHAYRLVANEEVLNGIIVSSIAREHAFVAGCLKNTWPMLAPKVDPGRRFVRLFCQNLKLIKESHNSVIEGAHSNREYYEWIHRRMIMLTERIITLLEKSVFYPTKQSKQLIKHMKQICSQFKIEAELKALFNDMKTILLKTLYQEGNKKIIALDTEMVGAGCKGHIHMVARVTLVDKNNVIYDEFVYPRMPVTDYRTFVSGVKASDLDNASDFTTVQKEVADLIRNRILIGHDLENDLKVLNLKHPEEDIRDTALYGPFRKVPHEKPSLKKLSKEVLDRDIQSGEHSSIQDATAARDLYFKVAEQWERMVQLKYNIR